MQCLTESWFKWDYTVMDAQSLTKCVRVRAFQNTIADFQIRLRVRDWVRLPLLNSLSRPFGCYLSCEYRSLSILLRWSATGRNEGFDNVMILKCESRAPTQSRTRSPIWRSLMFDWELLQVGYQSVFAVGWCSLTRYFEHRVWLRADSNRILKDGHL